uniref:Uncharacterized protein n=1 Tax=Myotis myotis TaxID=51298 RepID=A0A7J7QSU9_MYOMY|nr:hypothetical protein mMyoMyo1_011847 [Myotis myotis]
MTTVGEEVTCFPGHRRWHPGPQGWQLLQVASAWDLWPVTCLSPGLQPAPGADAWTKGGWLLLLGVLLLLCFQRGPSVMCHAKIDITNHRSQVRSRKPWLGTLAAAASLPLNLASVVMDTVCVCFPDPPPRLLQTPADG